MADGVIGVQNPAVTDSKLDTEVLTVGANTVHRERMLIAGTAATALADVLSAPPSAGAFGLSVRPVGQLVDNAAFTDGTSPLLPVGFIFDEVAGTALTENDVAAARLDSKRALISVLEDATTRGQRAAVSATGVLAVETPTTGVTILASGGRTTTQTQADQTNNGYTGIAVILDVTTPGTGSITVSIEGKDPASGKYVPLLTGAAVTTAVTNTYTVHPGITAAANVAAALSLWRTYRVVVTANNANSITYSVGAVLLP